MKKLALLTIGATLAIAGFAGAQHPHKSVRKSTHYITAAKARASALKRYHGTVIGKVALENEDGKMQYSVNVRSGKTLREIMVDAKTGKIASVEVTTKAEEAKEAAAEKKAASGKGLAKKRIRK